MTQQPLLTSESALDVLKRTRNKLILRARYEAVKLIQKYSYTHTREVRDALKAAGVLPENIDDRWLGAVFSGCDLFEATAVTVPVSDPSRNIHSGRATRCWRLKPEYKNIVLDDPPNPDEYIAKERVGAVDKLLRKATEAHGPLEIKYEPTKVEVKTTFNTWTGATLEATLRSALEQKAA